MNRITIMAILIVGLVGVSAAGAFALQVGDQAPTFKLADQYGKTWNLADLRGNVIVLVAATKESGRAMEPWLNNMEDKYGTKVQLLELIDLHGIPGFAHGIARSRIKKETQEPLIIDFNGATGKAYEVSDKHPVIVVIDRNGVIRDIEKAEYSPAGFKKVTAAVDKIL